MMRLTIAHLPVPGFLLAALLLASSPLSADVVVLRSGRQVRGELVSVSGATIEFRERTGSRWRNVEFDRDDVLRIEFSDDSSSQSSGIGRPAGLREREIVVSADVAWNDTGIDVRPGQTVSFDATGRVRWGPDRRDGPAGERGSPRNPNRPIPSRPGAALIGKIGSGSADVFFIGDEKEPIRMRAGGRLFLGVNDDVLGDNSGNFRVTVYY
jgi:hypothetical protein